ncbi:MAG: alpha-mannosidase, partial [Candidatus Hydrogenedentes bacterium]|nr:alpha-mannosidase [Candidatus Hydrogenedentota bacterium]
MKKEKNIEVGHVVTHTHWDREWRYPIWRTRQMLVECFDLLLDTLDANPTYRAFLLDGQVVPVEDYLLIRPENETRIKDAVKSGRLFIGPWYTLPDEFPIDGECLVRNLLKGHRVAAKYGDVMKVGYTSFGWGQPAQLPQIYAGFGIDTVMFGKRVSRERAPKSEFLWESPDGTRVLTTRLGMFSRQNFYFTCVIPVCFGEDIIPNDITFDWLTGGLPFKPVDEEGAEMDYFRVTPHDTFHPEKLEQGVLDAWSTTEDTLVKSHRFMGDGCDFAYPQPTISRIIEEANKLFDDRELRHSTLPEYMDALRESLNGEDLNVVRGELRDGPASSATCNALATRSYIKFRNRHVQNRLIRRAEPMAAMAYALGAEYPERFLELAWDYLLKSHPHDSINGVTQDKTAEDVMYRLSQVGELASVIENIASREILKRVNFGDGSTDDVYLALFNPLPFTRSEVIKVIADTPAERDISIVTVEEDGRQMDVQRMACEDAVPLESDQNSRPRGFYATRHTFYMDTGDVPAGGYKILRITDSADTGEDWPLPESVDNSILVEPGVMENEYLRVEVNSDGTFDLTDKDTGRVYPGQLEFEDSG